MTRGTILLIAAFTLIAAPAFSAEPPQVTLENNGLSLLVYLPDAENGYYRGSRFEWSGLIQQASYDGHTFFGDWKSTHNPTNHDDVNGTASEFGMFTPLGFDEAAPRETFVKMGIGELVRPNREDYRFHTNYSVKTAYDWSVKHGPDWIEFIQQSPDFKGWAYRFVKRIEIPPERPAFTIYHSLENTGTRALDTDYYCHNFTIIDDEPIGPAYELTFAFEPVFPQDLKGYARVEGERVQFVKALSGTSIYAEFEGYDVVPETNAVTICNNDSGAGLRIKGDYGAYEYHYWSTTLATCPEPFIKIDLAPGESMEWTDTYTLMIDACVSGGDNH